MNSEMIREAIARWTNYRTDSEVINGYLSQGNEFAYEFPSYAANSQFIHAYPGIHENILYFFLIPSKYDSQEFSDIIDQYTIPCPVANNLSGGSHEISAAEARARIQAWKAHYAEWVPEQINNTTYGLFQAFAIASQDFEVRTEPVTVTLGLKQSALAEVDYDADLIVANPDGKLLMYDDFVHSVPPYGTSAMSQNSFSLLPLSN